MNTPSPTFAHLDPRMVAIAAADAATRIRTIEKDLFIEHDYSRYLGALLEQFVCGPRQTRMPCLLILGDAGMGKTAQLHRFQRHFPDRRDDEHGQIVRPIVIANTPPEPTRQTIEAAVLEALGAPMITRGRHIDRAAVARRMLTAHQTKVLIFDEIQHICHARARDRAVVLDTIKGISTTCQISVICAGSPGVERDFLADPQIERRFEVTQFTAWTVGTAFGRFLGTYERARPLRLPSNLAEPTMMRAVLDEAAGVTHRIIQRLNAAAIVAVLERIERITPELLTVQRLEPARVLAARRAVLGSSNLMIGAAASDVGDQPSVVSATRVGVVPEGEARL
jgi:Bacterial TniB protein